jgi:hypothetical protein
MGHFELYGRVPHVLPVRYNYQIQVAETAEISIS